MAVTERRTQVYLTEEQYQAATRLARERDASLAAVLRQALDEFLARTADARRAPWAEDSARDLAGALELPPLSGEGGEDDLVEAIDRSVYDDV